MNSNHLRIAFVVLASMASSVALAEDGVTDKTIVFGQVAALTGPAQDLGQGMRQGILAAFDAVFAAIRAMLLDRARRDSRVSA